jgi:hypothetical protein
MGRSLERLVPFSPGTIRLIHVLGCDGCQLFYLFFDSCRARQPGQWKNSDR